MDPVLFYKLLADDTRLKCLMLISAEEELCVCELMQALSLSQPKISRHLAQLREANFLTSRRQGKWVFYQINQSLPDWCQTILETSLKNNANYLQDAVSRLTRMGNRPERSLACCG